MKRCTLVYLLCLLCSGGYLSAQENGENSTGAWYMYFGTHKLDSVWSLHSEAQFRLYGVGQNFNQLLLRTGLNYHISSKAVATGGYAYIDTDTSFENITGERLLKEHRLFEQFIIRNSLGRLRFEHRYRLEQRFLDNGENQFTEHRARYRLLLSYPLNGHWWLHLYDEVFVNLQEPLFGQNRLYAALGYQVHPKVQIQAGYLKNHFTGAHFDRLQLGVFVTPAPKNN